MLGTAMFASYRPTHIRPACSPAVFTAYRRGTKEKKGRKVEQQSARKRKERTGVAPPARMQSVPGSDLGAFAGPGDLDAGQADYGQGEAEEEGSEDEGIARGYEAAGEEEAGRAAGGYEQ